MTQREAGTDYAGLCERLRGKYRTPITDGLGPAGGEEPDNPYEHVRTFQTPPIQKEAAEAIEALVRERDEARQERDNQYEENVNRIAAEGAAILRADTAESRLASFLALAGEEMETSDETREALAYLCAESPDHSQTTAALLRDFARLQSRSAQSHAKGFAAGIEAAAKVAEQWLSAQFARLHAGELTAGEMRVVRAIIPAIAGAIRQLTATPEEK